MKAFADLKSALETVDATIIFYASPTPDLYDPSFMNTASCRSAITYLDGENGVLEYRGYPIEQLAEHSTYLEVAYLLSTGELPTAGQLDSDAWAVPGWSDGDLAYGGEQAEPGRQGPIAADAIRRPVPRRRHQPGARVAGDALARPPLGGDGERLLRGLLGEVKVAEKADQGGQDAAPLRAEDLIERRYQYTSEGRISTAPP